MLEPIDLAACPSCGAMSWTRLYPAFFAPGFVDEPQRVLVDGSSECFHHPGRAAVAACQRCGRFLCSLCVVDFGGEQICPSCIAARREKGAMRELDQRRILYDHIALSLAIVSIFISCFSIVTAPASLYMAIRHWKTPCSIVSPLRTRINFVLSILISSGVLFVWLLILAYAFHV